MPYPSTRKLLLPPVKQIGQHPHSSAAQGWKLRSTFFLRQMGFSGNNGKEDKKPTSRCVWDFISLSE
jgi:hypothetical protein